NYRKNQDRGSQRAGQVNKNHHAHVNGYQQKGNRAMGKAAIEEQMVNMISIGTERRTAFKDPDRKYAERIQQGDHQNGKTYGRRGFHGSAEFRSVSRIYEFQCKNGVDHANQQGSRVAHKYFCRLKIKDQKSKQTATKGKSKCIIWRHPLAEKINSEKCRRHHSQGTGQSVHSIYQVKGIDDYDYGKIRE